MAEAAINQEDHAAITVEVNPVVRRKKQNLFTSRHGQEAVLDFVPRKAAALHEGHIVDLCDSIEDKPRFVMNPLGEPRMLWDALAMCFIAFQAVLIPAEVAFARPAMSLSVPYNAWWVVDLLIGLFFLVDFVLNCTTGYVTETGLHVWAPKRILRHYFLRFPFHGIFDWVSLLPLFILIVEAAMHDDAAPDGNTVAELGRVSRLSRFARYATVLKMLRLVRLTRAAGIARKMSEVLIFTGRYSSAAWSFLSVAFWFGLIVHYVSCLLAVASEDFSTTLYGDSPYSADRGVNAWEQYTFAIWWAVMTLAGGSPPTNPTGTWDFWLWTIITFFFLLSVNVMVGVFCTVVDKFMQDERDLHDQLEVAMRFVTRNGLSESLKSRVLGTIRNAHVKQREEGAFEESIEPLLSEDLRRKVKGAMYNSLLKRFPPFQKMSNSVLNSIAAEATYSSYVASDKIFAEGEPAESMIFMTSGAAMLKSKMHKFQMPNVSAGWWLDERAVLGTSGNPTGSTRPYTCVALQPSSVLEISREVFQEACSCHTSSREVQSNAAPPFCPVCGENHEVWDCQVLVPVEVDSEDECGGTRLEELGKASREMFERHAKKKQLSIQRALPASAPQEEPVIAGPAAPAPKSKKSKNSDEGDGDKALQQVAEGLQQLVRQVRSLEDSLGGRLSAVETGIGELGGRLATLEGKAA